jgi:hypothetical protein
MDRGQTANVSSSLQAFVHLLSIQGLQTDVPKEKVILAERYQQLAEQLSHFGQTPEDAVKHYRTQV